MARNCNCSGSTCGCQVMAGTGIAVTGIGTAADPFVITNTGASLAQALSVQDTSTLDLVKTGSGTNLDPTIISGNVTLKMQQLIDVSNPGGNPVAGQAPQYVGVSGADGHWEFKGNVAVLPSVSGMYYLVGRGVGVTTGATTNGVFRSVPVYIPTITTIARIGVEVTAAGQSGSVIRIGIYADNNGLPGALVRDFGTVPGDAIAAAAEIAATQVLQPGWYHIGTVTQAAATTPPTCRLVVASGGPGDIPATVGTTPIANQAQQIGYLMTGLTANAALPSTFTSPGGAVTASATRVFYKTA